VPLKYDPNIHHRRSIRLKGYDYTQPGAYFITIVTYQHQEIFGSIVEGKMHLSKLGEIAQEEWFRSIKIRKEICLYEDEFIIMPNHIHGIVWIVEMNHVRPVRVDGVDPNNVNHQGVDPTCVNQHSINPLVMGEHHSPPHADYGPRQPAKSLPSFVSGYKSVVTGRAKREFNSQIIWQRNYYDHIIRNKQELMNIWKYIDINPKHWGEDQLNPSSPPNKFNRM
jgi:putative transposase